MVWNVYREDFNNRAIVKYNIFDHGGFARDVNELLKANVSRDKFAERLKRSLMYCSGVNTRYGKACGYKVTYWTKELPYPEEM